MATVVIQEKQLPGELRRRAKQVRMAIQRGAIRGAHRGKRLITMLTPVDRGELKNSWKVAKINPRATALTGFLGDQEIVRLWNLAPHAGIVELGARPHKVSDAGMLALEDWVWRNRASIGLTTKSGRAQSGAKARTAARSIAWAIAWKIRRKGQKPTYFIRNNLRNLRAMCVVEVDRAIKRQASKKSKGKRHPLMRTPKGGK